MSLEQPNRPKELDRDEVFKVILHFARHGQKAGPNDVPLDVDLAMRLTEKGRGQAHTLGAKAETARPLAIGGERRRLRETALRASVGANQSAQDLDFSELLELADEKGERYGNRMWKIPGLDFALTKEGPDFEEINNAKQYFRKLVELDDEHRGDSVYARHAYGIARILDWTARAAPKLRQRYLLHTERGQADSSDGPVREAFVSAQGGVSESFLAEVILRTRGREGREKFIAAVPNGFAETRGFDTEIISSGTETSVRISCTAGEGEHAYRYDETVPLDLIQTIMEDFAPNQA